MLAPSSLWARHWGDATWMLARRGGRESEKGVSAGAWRRSTGAGWIDCGESGRERSPPAWSQGSGTGRRRRSDLAHDVSIVLGVGRHSGSQPHANPSITIMRAPQRGHGQGSKRGASGAISDCCCGSAAGGATSRNARAVVTNIGNDRSQLSMMAKQAQEAMGVCALTAIADRVLSRRNPLVYLHKPRAPLGRPCCWSCF